VVSDWQRLIERMRRSLRGFLHFPDRVLQPGRRNRVRQQVAGRGRIERILVVCSGNICRSPYFAAVLQRRMPAAKIASAGFVGFNRPVPENSLAVSAARGIDLSTFRSHLLDPRRARSADLVVVMEPRQARYLADYYGVPKSRVIVAGDLDPVTSPARLIEDPWRQPKEVFESTFDRIDRCADALCEILAQAHSPSTSNVERNDRVSSPGGATPDQLPQPVL
jgi:protein-tyrosine phosphatase